MLSRRGWWASALAGTACSVLAVALILANSESFNLAPMSTEMEAQASGLAKMKGEVQAKLVAAAKRRALARMHRAQAEKLASNARAEKLQAAEFETRSKVSEEEAELKHADSSAKMARAQVKSDRKKATALRVAADKDQERAEEDKARAMEFSDTEGALMQQAAEDEDEVKAVMAKEQKTAEALPVLMQAAKVDESRAHKLMANARARMSESKQKAAAALRLDRVVKEKEAAARASRSKLISILGQKSVALDQKAGEMNRSDGKIAIHKAAQERIHGVRAANLWRSGRESERRQVASGDKSRAKLMAEKPARMMMLGDTIPQGSDGLWGSSGNGGRTTLLSKGPVDSVVLEKDPDFEMLWEDPSSLRSVTHDLGSTTRHMEKLAPRQSVRSRDLSDSVRAGQEELYEDGHSSRREDAFRREMSKYRVALQQARAADERKAQLATQELAQLPGGGREGPATPRDFEARRGRDWHRQQHQAFGALLTEPQNGWDPRGTHAYTDMQRRVLARDDEQERGREREAARGDYEDDEDGGRREDRRGETREGDGREGYAVEERNDMREDGLRRSRIARLQDELQEAKRRDRELEDRTERLQGEMDELRRDHARGDSGYVEQQDERGRRQRLEGARRRVEERHRRGRDREREPRDGGSFHPDATYEKSYASDPGHVSVAEIKFQHALKGFQRTKSILREGAMQDDERDRMPALIPAHLPGQGLS